MTNSSTLQGMLYSKMMPDDDSIDTIRFSVLHNEIKMSSRNRFVPRVALLFR